MRSERRWPSGVEPAVWSQADSRAVAKALQAMSDRAYPIVIGGAVGVGKSCLAALLWSLVPGGRWIDASELIGHVMTARTSDSRTSTMPLIDGGTVDRTEGEIMRWVEQAPILVLDDVGKRQLTEPQADALLRIVNLRHGKPLVCTTNCTGADLPAYVGERINSRLRAGLSFRIDGADRRPAAKGGQ